VNYAVKIVNNVGKPMSQMGGLSLFYPHDYVVDHFINDIDGKLRATQIYNDKKHTVPG